MKDLPPGVRTKVYGPEYISREFSVAGLVRHPGVFTAEMLRRRPRVSVEEVPLICGSGRIKGARSSFSGVLLAELLDEAEIRIDAHEDPNRMCILATGRDGYGALFSWHEIFNTTVGDGLLVALEKDGAPLGGDEGELMLVSTRDLRPGPRRIRYLCTVEVKI